MNCVADLATARGCSL